MIFINTPGVTERVISSRRGGRVSQNVLAVKQVRSVIISLNITVRPGGNRYNVFAWEFGF